MGTTITELAAQPSAGQSAERAYQKPYATDSVEVIEALKTNLQRGLNADEVAARRERYGTNTIQSIRSRAAWRILLDQFASLVIALLGAAAIVALVTGDVLDAIAILVVLVINALVGFATEWQAGRALDALRRQAVTTARVRRDEHEITLPAEELVPGDIVILNAGDHVPADARILEAATLRAEESALTGESTTVEKSPAPVAAEALLAERSSMLYLGTAIAAGRAVAVVTATGAETELGRIGRLVAEAPEESTPLKRKLDDLGRRLVYLVMVIGAIVAFAGWLRGDDLWMMIEVGISLAVAAVPEALPAVTTLILALGVLRMARQQAIVRRLASVETLGSTTIICSDKTGTLTENRMTVREYHLPDGSRIELHSHQLPDKNNQHLARAIRVGVLCNEAAFHRDADGTAQSVGDPTETALLLAAASLGIDVVQQRSDYPKLDERPFDAVTKRMITIHRTTDGSRLALLKGAPNVVLEACSVYLTKGESKALDAEMREQILLANRHMAERALRVLALAEKQLEDENSESAYTFLGFVGMIDPPRAGVAEAIRQAQEAGIRVVMLTGDQIHTAQAIAHELRLCGEAEPQARHARDLEDASHQDIAQLALTTDVFARVSPEDKLHIVEALQKAGEIVAVTGDGVNDAPALKRADIGVAMGMRGTEVAKEAADVVLADDNFATILSAVEGGRTIYANIIRFVHLMFSKNLGTVLAIFIAIVIGWPLPLLPLQILWVNLLTDVFPALALALEPTDRGIMQRPPRPPDGALLSHPFLLLISWQGALLAAIILAAYGWALQSYGAGSHARTVALFALIGVQVGHMFNCRSRTHSAFEGFFRNPFIWGAIFIVIILQALALYQPFLARVLDTHKLNATDWGIIAATIILPILVVEITKAIFRSRTARLHPGS
ncbi:MAG: cation-transporting P-type ATPase [Acidobacteria bacterium]|nr:cation-transporting P-type ATPase [Acidobacteriota bacterium]